MYIDFSQTEKDFFDVDVCIIGSGAAGFACGVSLLNTGLNVLIVEGGIKLRNSIATDLQQAEVTGHRHTGIHEARERIIGGTTTLWGGQALPFMTEDFEQRSHVELSGWPLSLKELEPYYVKAEKILGTDASVSFDYRPWKDWRIEEPAFSTSRLSMFVTKWCKVPDFSLQHGNKIKQSNNVHLLSNANVTELLPNEELNGVASLSITSLENKKGSIKAKYVIAAGGAIETVRLFLSSKQFGNAGVGNKHNLVGYYFQDHVAATVGELIPASRKRIHEIFDPFYKNGFKYFPRIKLLPAMAKQLGLLHASAQMVFREQDDEILNTAKAVLQNIKRRKKPWTGVKNIKMLANPFKIYEMGKAAWRWNVTKRGSSSKGPILIEVHSEQNPDRKSNIQISSSTDKLGNPRVNLHWAISDLTVKTIRSMAQMVKEEFEKAGMGKVVLKSWVTDASEDCTPWLTDVYHQAGGLRMASDEEDGVVDAQAKVFGISNLYVASSAVFPTSSFSNPTMTTIALSIRICENVVKELKTEKTLLHSV